MLAKWVKAQLDKKKKLSESIQGTDENRLL